MAKISLYLDEHIQITLAEALGARSVDVLTTQAAGNIGVDDEKQLVFAAKQNRVLFSYNKRDFAILHYRWLNLHKSHSGIILSDQLPVGIILRRLMKLYFTLSFEDMLNRLEYLGIWK